MQKNSHKLKQPPNRGKASLVSTEKDSLPDLAKYIPESLSELGDLQSNIPKIAKNKKAMNEIKTAISKIPTFHQLSNSDSRNLSFISDESVHLVLTSPPYWTLKEYNLSAGQMGAIENYELFLSELDKVWSECWRILVPGGRVICVVGDVCLSRRRNNGRHTVVPLHASIQERCRNIGFDNLSPIIWHKIANARFEANGNGGGFLGKPYEPNAIIKNDIEFILMERKPGGYRKPNREARILSTISEANHREWFQSIWHGLTGASTKNHPAPFPLDLAERLVQMYSFVGDTVVDPFLGSGTTSIAALHLGRNSIGCEIDSEYFQFANKRIQDDADTLSSEKTIELLN